VTDLSDKMRVLADEGHERADELREHAAAFDVAAEGYYGETQTVEPKAFLGTWSRARRVWCECSGEPLV
jgi:hypothetical protein